jgi:hypothetical protein
MNKFDFPEPLGVNQSVWHAVTTYATARSAEYARDRSARVSVVPEPKKITPVNTGLFRWSAVEVEEGKAPRERKRGRTRRKDSRQMICQPLQRVRERGDQESGCFEE